MRELARLTNVHLNAIRRELANLEALGIIASLSAEQVSPSATAAGGGSERAKYFQLNSTSLLYSELAALLLKAQVVEEQELISALKKRGGKIKLFTLTGVFTGAADVSTDLLLVGDLKPLVIARLIRAYEQNNGKTIRYTLLSEREFRERREIGDKFLYSVFESRQVSVINHYNLGSI